MSSDIEIFTQHPLTLDPTSKAISASSSSSPSLNNELNALNTLHRSLIALDPPNIPPAPRPVNPKRSTQINKLRDTANNSYRKSAFEDAVKLYTYGIDMALGRPSWEPLALVREELSGLYANRSQAYMAQSAWAEGWVDAKMSVECMPGGNAKAWWRGGRCLVEMGRWEEARKWVKQALAIEGKNGESTRELNALMTDIENGLKKITGA